MILEFSVLCKNFPANSNIVESFVNDNSTRFLDLSVDELSSLAEVAVTEPSGTVDITRRMYALALQVCVREHNTKSYICSYLYCKLIELSPTRSQALEKIREFTQLLKCMPFSNATVSAATESSDVMMTSQNYQNDSKTNKANTFSLEDIDQICSIAYNSGVTLLTIEQFDLAEEFIDQSIQMLPYVSNNLSKEWCDKIKVSYSVLVVVRFDWYVS